MSACPTVQIVDEQTKSGYRIINKTDFNPNIHTLFEEKQQKPTKPNTQSKAQKTAKTPKTKPIESDAKPIESDVKPPVEASADSAIDARV